jgi:hypothetical protein
MDDHGNNSYRSFFMSDRMSLEQIRAAPGILWILLAKAPTLPKDRSLIVQMEHIAGGVESIANKLIYRVKLYFIASRA